MYGKSVVLSWFRIYHHVISCRLRLLIISCFFFRSHCSHSSSVSFLLNFRRLHFAFALSSSLRNPSSTTFSRPLSGIIFNLRAHLWRILKPNIGLPSCFPCPISLCAVVYNCYMPILALTNTLRKLIESIHLYFLFHYCLDSGERKRHEHGSEQSEKNVTVTWKININWKSKVAFTN